MPAGDFATALRRASLLTTKEAQSVTMDFSSRRLTLSSRAPEVGEAKVELEIPYEDAPERLGFNPAFILDALKVMDPARPVRFEFTNPKAPGKLTDGVGYVYVVMPGLRDGGRVTAGSRGGPARPIGDLLRAAPCARSGSRRRP